MTDLPPEAAIEILEAVIMTVLLLGGIAYGALVGYLFTRPSKQTRRIVVRALLAQERSPDAIIAKEERRLIQRLQLEEDA